jgi:oligopeptide/dipeptide ABC transporter ATP-binding protein
LIEAGALSKHYAAPRGWRDIMRGTRPIVRAVDGIDLVIARGESVGLVGESGSGKTTLGRLLLRLATPTSGWLAFDGEDIPTMRGARIRRFRQQAQLVFQNPFEALNPRFTIRRVIAEPLVNTGIPRAEHTQRISNALTLVHLPATAALLESYPHHLSGGQLQRVVLARALVLQPSFLIADEPVSMLDVSVRAGVLNLLREVRDTLGLTSLTISHDLALVRYVCERVLVMYLGRIVEDGPVDAVIRRPAHPYTQALIAAVPRPHVEQDRAPLPLRSGVPSGVSTGCRFRDRCPHAFAPCVDTVPELRATEGGQRVACHLHDDIR